MKNLTARDLQVFVAGAFAIMGFGPLISLPHYFYAVPSNKIVWSYVGVEVGCILILFLKPGKGG